MRLDALDRKLLRDLWAQRGPVLAIALIVGSGLAVLIMSLSVVDSLQETRRAYYQRFGFADVFATAKRAPDTLADRIAEIPGVGVVETRIVKDVLLDVPGFREPATARLISLPEDRETRLNGLALRAGRLPQARSEDEVVILESLANGHGLAIGDSLSAIINRKKQDLRVVGIALSPEFVYAIGPGSLMPDEKRFGVLWMRSDALAGAFDLDGAFNDVSVSLMHGSSAGAVIEQVDRLLDPYGGTGAIARKVQTSNWFVTNEIEQLYALATVLPAIFLGVAAFVMNVVVGRLVALERGQIGLLKAFGYGPAEIGRHYGLFVLTIALLGLALGIVAGSLFGRQMTELYTEQFRFPVLIYWTSLDAVLTAGLAAIGAALVGGVSGIRAAMALPPAEAMRPATPAAYRRTVISRLAAGIDQPTRMIARHLIGHPTRTLTTVAGIAVALGVLIMSLSWRDSIAYIELDFFERTQQQDVSISLREDGAHAAVHAIARLPGVLVTEPIRSVPVRLKTGTTERLESLVGLPKDPRLFRPHDAAGRPINLPEHGLMISTTLADLMGVVPGDRMTVEARTDRRPTADLAIVGTFETLIGSPLYAAKPVLDRFMGDGERFSGAHLRVDPRHDHAFFSTLKGIPEVAAVSSKSAALGEFRRTLDETMDVMISVYVAFGCVIAFGVVYNAARVSLSERERDLASLRVLGFTRGEVAYVLLGELAVLSVLALPLGCLSGYVLKAIFTSQFNNELFRIALVIEPATYGTGLLVGLAAILCSGLIMHRKVNALDMITALKTRE